MSSYECTQFHIESNPNSLLEMGLYSYNRVTGAKVTCQRRYSHFNSIFRAGGISLSLLLFGKLRNTFALRREEQY